MSDATALTLTAIGHVRSPFRSKVGVPIQTAGAPDVPGELIVLPPFAAGLKDLDAFENLILLTHLHLVAEESLEVVPFLDTVPRGVFATRAPNRPNRIGLSVVRLVSIDGLRIRFAGNDMVDGTPVLDIKPYVPAFDVRQTSRIGWFSAHLDQLPGKLSDGRMG